MCIAILDRGFWNFRFFEQLMAAQFDLVTYLTTPENRDLGVVKATRPKRPKPPLDLSPFPQSQVLTTVAFALSCHQCLLPIILSALRQPTPREKLDQLGQSSPDIGLSR